MTNLKLYTNIKAVGRNVNDNNTTEKIISTIFIQYRKRIWQMTFDSYLIPQTENIIFQLESLKNIWTLRWRHHNGDGRPNEQTDGLSDGRRRQWTLSTLFFIALHSTLILLREKTLTSKVNKIVSCSELSKIGAEQNADKLRRYTRRYGDTAQWRILNKILYRFPYTHSSVHIQCNCTNFH